jgi:hypothetical protein
MEVKISCTLRELFALLHLLFVDGAEHITQLAEILQYLWQSIFQAIESLEAVVKNDDGTRACVLDHVFQHLLRAEGLVEIAAEYVPHHHIVVAHQKLALAGRHFAIGRAKQGRLQLTRAVANVAEVAHVVSAPAIEVVHGVVAHGMSRRTHLLVGFRVFANVVAHTKESGFGVEALQLFKHPGCYFRDGAIVKSQEQLLGLGRHFPSEIWKKVLDELGCLDQVHVDMF